MRALLREVGIEPLRLMGAYQLKLKSGWLKMITPQGKWASALTSKKLHPKYRSDIEITLRSNKSRSRFFFHPETNLSDALQKLPKQTQDQIIIEADEILGGSFRLFGGPTVDLGSPPTWNQFPPTDAFPQSPPISMDKHWSEYPLETFPIDIKLIWEPSRFGWAYVLSRAYRLTKDEIYLEGFWRYLESWRLMNPPNCGPNWISGQEIALRLLALVFSWYGFYPALDRAPERLSLLAEMIAVHAERIPITFDYARAQENNHLISEACGLYTVGLLFPEFLHAARWKTMGRKWIEHASVRQFFTDGGYIQHSINYHRFALQLLLWVFRLAEVNEEPFSDQFRGILQRSVEYLKSFVDSHNGATPNFGHNDGSRAMQLESVEYGDYRAIIQTAQSSLGLPLPYPEGAWDEARIWLGNKQQRAEEEKNQNLPTVAHVFPQSGIATIRSGSGRAILRCADFENRPGQSDQLHLDLWFQGVNVLLDPGTYLYNGRYPWDNRFAGSEVHNTIRIDEREPMRRASKFLWSDWAQGSLREPKRSEDGKLLAVEAEFAGYPSMGVTIQRTVVKTGDLGWMVIDHISGRDEHRVQTGWLFPDGAWEIAHNHFQLSSPLVEMKFESVNENSMALFRAGECLYGKMEPSHPAILGWYSPTYAIKNPALFLIVESVGSLPTTLVTFIGLGHSDWNTLSLEWRTSGGIRSGVRRIKLRGAELEL